VLVENSIIFCGLLKLIGSTLKQLVLSRSQNVYV
jgi:hypothetical protein